jgi:16S rRNA A1518/A1519 N6-dimethyltransferase RsmA/KsgA/DIM1 with predicted DNA glycosylase/AP lyase activity
MDPFEDPKFVERFNSRRLEQDSVNACIDEPAILERIRSFSPSSVLEFGCATGMLTSSLLEYCERVVAVDRSLHMGTSIFNHFRGRAAVCLALSGR